MSDASSFFNFYRAAESEKPRDYPWFISLIRMLLAILFLTLITNIGIVMLLPDGLMILKNTYAQEVQYLSTNIDSQTTLMISSWVNLAYEYVFIKTGIHGYLYSGGNQLTGSLISGMWPYIQGAIIGFQIFMIRLSVIILMLPFVILVMLVAASDGYLEWFRRRTGGARESAFIYHRSKHLVSWSLVGLWVLYLVPPVAVDPLYVFLPTIAFIFVFTKLSVQFFKKYI